MIDDFIMILIPDIYLAKKLLIHRLAQSGLLDHY